MEIKNIFDKKVTAATIARIDALKPNTQPLWGKMQAGQMLAHCSVAYEMVYENIHPKPKGLKKWLLKTFVKNAVVNERPYKKNTRTAPEFLITGPKEFQTEKQRLIAYIEKTQALGGAHFDGLASHSFGPLSQQEWNNLFYKHLDHHLNQFGV
ncbi:MAG: DUF1569 domain-containing protein [Flavobacteriaceae bacterium]